MLEDLANVTTVVSTLFGAASGFIGGYLSVKLTLKDHENRLNNQLDRNVGLERADDQLRADVKEQDKKISAQGNELIDAERKLNIRISDLERRLPNCDAHKQELLRALETLRGDITATLLTKIGDISETNSRFREEVRAKVMTDSQAFTKETINSTGVAAIVNDKIDVLRAGELKDIFRRLHELETGK